MKTIILDNWSYEIPINTKYYEFNGLEVTCFDKKGTKLIRYISHNISAEDFITTKFAERKKNKIKFLKPSLKIKKRSEKTCYYCNNNIKINSEYFSVQYDDGFNIRGF